MKYFFTLLIATSLSVSAVAQSRISISPEFNVPLGKLAWTYKATPGIHLNYSQINKSKKLSRGFGLAISYTALQPLKDTLYYVSDNGGVDGAGLGKATFSPFKIFRLEGTFDWSILMNKKVSFWAGFRAGTIFGKREMTFEDSFGAYDSSSENVLWVTATPLAGIELKFNKSMSMVPYVSYSLMIQAGTTNPNSPYYNESTGLFYHYCTTGVTLNFYF